MELLLVRHALPVRRELASGAADPELAPAGREQARRLADYLSTERLDAVYASPMRRAMQTAEPVAEAQRLDIVVEPGVAEWDQHSSEYVPVEELKATGDPRWFDMLAGVWAADEPVDAFVARTTTAIEAIIARHRGERVAVVCHGGVINTYLSGIIGITTPEGVPGFFYPNYTSVHRVAAASSGERSVVTVNETPHLRNSGLPIGLFQTG
jgi:probable phosphoglycerate mutase